jgi:hypothetical protein
MRVIKLQFKYTIKYQDNNKHTFRKVILVDARSLTASLRHSSKERRRKGTVQNAVAVVSIA